MAPNLVTLIGTLFMFLGVAMALINDYTFQKQAPPWMCVAFSFFMWAYSTCDNIDGKQARKTNSSSPLGELFDHGCDALVCSLGLIMKISALGLGDPKFLYITKIGALLIIWCFFIPTWEEYHTGVLYLGYINAPTEGIISFCILFLVTALFDQHTLLSNHIFDEYSPADIILCVYLLFSFAFFLPKAIYNINLVAKKTKPLFFRELLPMLLMTAFALNWWSNPFSLTNSPHYLIYFISILGIISGKYATKIIYAHLLSLKFPLFTRLMIPLVAGSILYGKYSLHAPFEHLYLPLALIGVIISYSVWTWHCVNSISRFLGIYCFSLQKRIHLD
jgi:ethanolaminephosphotransferase